MEVTIYTAVTWRPISTLIKPEFVNSQRRKVVDLVDIFDLIGGRPRNSFRIKSYGHFTNGRRNKKWKFAPANLSAKIGKSWIFGKFLNADFGRFQHGMGLLFLLALGFTLD